MVNENRQLKRSGGLIQHRRIEPRWPVLASVLALLLSLSLLSARVSVVPLWLGYAFGAAQMVPIAVVGLTNGNALCLRAERTITLTFAVISSMATIANLANLIRGVVDRTTPATGLQLLASSVALWITNIIIFSLVYWMLDRGGPEARMAGRAAKPDWQFPQSSDPDAQVGWHPTYTDYLFLAYTTATAFSPTDTLPLSSRAKALNAIESLIALATVLVVVSRAINILAS